MLKSIRVHLDLLISAITCSILDQFQNFKYHEIYDDVFYKDSFLTRKKLAVCPISKVWSCHSPQGM